MAFFLSTFGVIAVILAIIVWNKTESLSKALGIFALGLVLAVTGCVVRSTPTNNTLNSDAYNDCTARNGLWNSDTSTCIGATR